MGSFVGLVVARLPEAISVVRPRSRCDGCLVPLAWYDNLPVVSFVLLRGRCRHCKMAYGCRSVLVELLMGMLFVALGSHLGPSLMLVGWLVFSAGLMAITFLDIDHFWVPDAITYPLMAWALMAAALPSGPTLVTAFLGLVPAALMWGVAEGFRAIMGKEGLGFGDIKLLAALGLMMGLPATLTVLFVGSAQGAILGSIIVAAGGHKERAATLRADEEAAGPIGAEAGCGTEDGLEVAPEDPWVPDAKAVPFGPFLVLAAFEVLFFPDVFANLLGRLVGA